MRIGHQKGVYAGLIFITFVGLTTWLSGDYHIGASARMGPGYFPFCLGGVMTALGAITVFNWKHRSPAFPCVQTPGGRAELHGRKARPKTYKETSMTRIPG